MSPPGWPTSLAVITWQTVDRRRLARHVEAGTQWILSARSEVLPRSSQFGHDTQIVAWSYAEHTHSWIEPTALHVVALKSAGRAGHERTRDEHTEEAAQGGRGDAEPPVRARDPVADLALARTVEAHDVADHLAVEGDRPAGDRRVRELRFPAREEPGAVARILRGERRHVERLRVELVLEEALEIDWGHVPQDQRVHARRTRLLGGPTGT